MKSKMWNEKCVCVRSVSNSSHWYFPSNIRCISNIAIHLASGNLEQKHITRRPASETFASASLLFKLWMNTISGYPSKWTQISFVCVCVQCLLAFRFGLSPSENLHCLIFFSCCFMCVTNSGVCNSQEIARTIGEQEEMWRAESRRDRTAL